MLELELDNGACPAGQKQLDWFCYTLRNTLHIAEFQLAKKVGVRAGVAVLLVVVPGHWVLLRLMGGVVLLAVEVQGQGIGSGSAGTMSWIRVLGGVAVNP